MTEDTVSVTYAKIVLPTLLVDVGADYVAILVWFSRIIGHEAFFGSIRVS
jgi:hypothetical protein